MIEFPCLCGEKFSLPETMAGEMFQCKKCSRLVAVPPLDDLAHIGEDGTYDLGESAEAMRRGELRQKLTSEEANSLVAQTDESIPYEFEEPAKVAPRYDPFTGELIRQHEVVVTEESEEAKRPKDRGPISKMKDRGMVSAAPPMACVRLLGEMFKSRNIAVLFLMYAMNIFLALITSFVIEEGFFFAYALPVVVACICAGYYAIIVQETGPGEKDDLPTPMRDFDLRSDVWEPLVYMVVAGFCCLGPGIGFLCQTEAPAWVGYAILGLGMFWLPVFVLTACIGGILLNFRPDRMVRVIVLGGWDYLMVVIGLAAGAILLVDGLFSIGMDFSYTFAWPGTYLDIPWYVRGAALSSVMALVGLYLTYYACWLLGLIWRKHYQAFPWVGQKHERAPVPLPPANTKKKPTAV